MALPILSNWLSKKIRYSFMATIVFRFMIGSNVLFDWACWKERYKVSLNSKTHLYMWQSNAYITNTLMDYFYPMHTACFDLLDQNGWKSGEISGDMCSSCFKITNCTYMYISSVVLYIYSRPRLLPSLIALARKTTSSFPQFLIGN